MDSTSVIALDIRLPVWLRSWNAEAQSLDVIVEGVAQAVDDRLCEPLTKVGLAERQDAAGGADHQDQGGYREDLSVGDGDAVDDFRDSIYRVAKEMG